MMSHSYREKGNKIGDNVFWKCLMHGIPVWTILQNGIIH